MKLLKLLKKVTAGLLLVFGIPLSIVAVTEIFDRETTPQDKTDALAALIILTLPATAVGGWLAWGLSKESQKEISDRLQSTFYRLLKQGNGQISILGFAMETHLPAGAAKQYLDEKAKEFNATFKVSEDGSVFYHFNELSALPMSESTVFASVILPNDYWTIGSTRDDVLRIQGTPTQVAQYETLGKEVFYYGSSSNIVFKKGRVVEYNNYHNNLKVFVGPSSPSK